ncbi:MAG: PD40 domain-containing protein [Dehalococcoidia bacterium]|nr:PD40 domain-containing protein [Dehalococcoidia bacterium]
MFAPGARQRPHAPHFLTPLALGIIAVCSGILLWAAFSTGTVTNEQYGIVAPSTPESIRSVAYTVPGENGIETLYIRPGGETSQPVLVRQFGYTFGLQSRGAASPDGHRISLIHVGDATGRAQLTMLDSPGWEPRDIEAVVDYLSPMTWSADGLRLAVARSETAVGGRKTVVVSEVLAADGVATEVARFSDVSQVAPVGYSLDGGRLYIVVLDQSGSSLWVRQAGRTEKVAVLSAGPTRDWSLSPDGSRLAFIERLGVGGRTYAGRTLLIATGAITDAAPEGDQLGTAWRPGLAVADFGGPDGSLMLDDPLAEETYVLPMRWSPDGSMLVATIYSASREGNAAPSETLQIVSVEDRWRVFLSPDEHGARFIGWVRDLE